ncbi:VOC family protein [Halomonas sp. GXIMD04776]|uniref:VOC family protein n=1 Tax=Halomonas sp. GXIMD04776 TaxID=3415605 RepID=UPI003C90FA2D
MKIEEVFPYLCVTNAAAAIDFYQRAFDVTETSRLTEPTGRIGHAELAFGPMTLMLSDEFPGYDIHSASTIGDTPVTIHLHVDDADAVIAHAVQAGAVLERAPEDQFFGERSGVVRDPFGHRWLIGHHIEDVHNDEMQRRYTQLLKGDSEPSG